MVKYIDMKGVSFVTNEKDEKIAIQIDMKTLEKKQEELEDFLEGLIAESRKEEEKVPLDKVIKNLKKAGKLK